MKKIAMVYFYDPNNTDLLFDQSAYNADDIDTRGEFGIIICDFSDYTQIVNTLLMLLYSGRLSKYKISWIVDMVLIDDISSSYEISQIIKSVKDHIVP